MQARYAKYEFEIIIILISFVFYFLYVGSDYYTKFVEGVSWSLDADARKTIYYLQTDYFTDNPLISLGSNFLGPAIILKIFNYNNFYVFVFNLASLLIPCHLVFRYYNIKRNLFYFWLFINPMIFFSLFTVNKEIPALSWVLMIACYFKSKHLKYLLLALVFSVLARYQLIMITVLYLIAEVFYVKLRFSRALIITGLIFGLTIVLPFFKNVEVLSFEADNGGVWESAAENKFGLLSTLTTLQNNFYLFFLVFIPKLIFNLVGPLYKVFFSWGLVVSTFFSNFYNIFITTVASFFFSLLVIKVFMKRKASFKHVEIYLAAIILIVYMANPILQVRYLIPAYLLGVIAITKRTTKKTYEGQTDLGLYGNI